MVELPLCSSGLGKVIVAGMTDDMPNPTHASVCACVCVCERESVKGTHPLAGQC